MEINVDPISYNKTTKKRLALEKNKFTDTLHYQSVRAFRVSLQTFIELVRNLVLCIFKGATRSQLSSMWNCRCVQVHSELTFLTSMS